MAISDSQRLELESLIKVGYDGSASDRAQMVLWDADGIGVAEIAKRIGASRVTIYKWLDRYASGGLAALDNMKSPGRPQVVDSRSRARILALTRSSPPVETGLTHWSSYEMAKYLKRHEGIDVSHNFVAQLWREHGLKPHRQGTFKLSRDPEFATKLADVIGLYLDPPQGAVVLSMDEKTQVQALERTQPLLPMTFDKTEQRTHDYKRHGTTNLFAALNVLTGQVVGRCFDRKRASEFLKFIDVVVKGYPKGQEIHVILDNISTHNTPDVTEWLKKHPNVTFHFTPVGSSWINQIEIWFGIITRQAIRRGSFASLADLIKRIDRYIKHWNEDAHPFEWTAKADDILEKVAILERDYKKLLANNDK